MTIAFISHADCALHDMGAGHPESPARLHAIQDQLVASGLELALRHFDAPLASREQLLRVHTRDHVDGIFARAPQQGRIWLDPDTAMNPHSLNAALRAAGASVLAVDLVMQGEYQSAFCSVRPPGHHAERGRAMGFCIFNNIAVATAHAFAAYGLQRIAIADFDVHHGNGTEDIFRDEPRLLFCSSFRHPYYPFSTLDEAPPHIIHTPLPAAADGAAFRAAVERDWLPALERFAPQLLLISAGFDAHAEDEMGGLRLREADYAWVSRELKQLAARHAEGRIVSCLEGGYALGALGRSVAAHLDALLGQGGAAGP
jgi:acetoin utilization deacetylase AcuC-like enzyme